MPFDVVGQARIFLSTVEARTADRRQAGATAVVFLLIFAAAAPFAKLALPRIWAFIPSYEAALIVSDLITATLLFAQFAILRARSLLALSIGYLFTALMAIPHALTFPGLFAPEGLLGAGPQTTAWLYMAWHAGFPLAVISFVVLSKKEQTSWRPVQKPGVDIAVGGVAAVAAVCGVTLIATAGHDFLPAIMADNHYTGAMTGTIATVWGLSLAALFVLWWRRPHSVLDLWLMVVMVAWLCDVGLSAALNAGRFDLGFYAGRVFGLLAAGFILLVLLLETGALYARLARTLARQAVEREARLQQLQQELIHVSRINELGQMVSTLTHEVNQPLTAAGNYLAAAQRLAGEVDAPRLAHVLERVGEQILRAGQIIDRLRQLSVKGEVARRPDDLVITIEEAISLATAGLQGPGVKVETIIDPAMPPVLIDRVQIQQVLLNLIRNAIEAMAGSPRRELVIRAAAAPNGMAEISIADTGPGLADTVRERLFQPFVTTKAAGMGVGLSICQSIIELHGGRIWASANPGGGTVFHFTLECVVEAEATNPARGILSAV